MQRVASRVLRALCFLGIAAPVLAAPVPVVDNRVIVDNAPFYSVGAEDLLGGLNFALNAPSFIDIPYVIFDFGAAASVSNAFLTWNFGSLFGGSGPAQITLYVGNDADGAITVADRFMGTAVATSTFAGGELWTVDVTALVNAALASGQFFAARLEATAAPGTLNGFYGGQFLAPSLDADIGRVVPEPGTLALLGLAVAGLAASRRTRS